MTDPLEGLDAHHVIRDAARFRELLDSPVCGILIKMVEDQNYNDLKRASDVDALRICQAKATVLDDVIHALRTVISAGERDAIERERGLRAAENARPALSGENE